MVWQQLCLHSSVLLRDRIITGEKNSEQSLYTGTGEREPSHRGSCEQTKKAVCAHARSDQNIVLSAGSCSSAVYEGRRGIPSLSRVLNSSNREFRTQTTELIPPVVTRGALVGGGGEGIIQG